MCIVNVKEGVVRRREWVEGVIKVALALSKFSQSNFVTQVGSIEMIFICSEFRSYGTFFLYLILMRIELEENAKA